MYVLSVEGPAHIDRGTWATHKVLAVYDTEAGALADLSRHRLMYDDEVVLLTDTSTGAVKRLPEQS